MESKGCSLAADELSKRLREWGAVIGTEVVSLGQNFPSTKTVHLSKSEGRIEEIQRLIALERECCPHLDISVQEDADYIVLTISES